MTDLGSEVAIDFETLITQYGKEEQKLINHPKFQQICSKFWGLLSKDEFGRISKDIYIGLMKRIYKILLPHYKKDEMEKEILSEWILDCHGRKDLDYNLLVLVLFRVSHSWCVHIDYEEYAFLLIQIYQRLTKKMKVKAGERSQILPNIIVTFPEEERKLKSSADKDDDNEDEEGAEWVE